MLTGPAPELEQGCCSYGAHFTDKADRKRVGRYAEQLDRRASGSSRPRPTSSAARSTRTRTASGSPTSSTTPASSSTAPTSPAGPAAPCTRRRVARDERFIDWKPDVCWQLPAAPRATQVDDNEHVTNVLREWKRRDWGEGGFEFHWWCTDAPEAFVGHRPVYEEHARRDHRAGGRGSLRGVRSRRCRPAPAGAAPPPSRPQEAALRRPTGAPMRAFTAEELEQAATEEGMIFPDYVHRPARRGHRRRQARDPHRARPAPARPPSPTWPPTWPARPCSAPATCPRRPPPSGRPSRRSAASSPPLTGSSTGPGLFVEAIESGRWLVIDELNRSNFDRAFGQLFTVLSGSAVVLPFKRKGQPNPLSIVPERRRAAREDRRHPGAGQLADHRHDERVRQEPAVRHVLRADAPLRVHRGGHARRLGLREAAPGPRRDRGQAAAAAALHQPRPGRLPRRRQVRRPPGQGRPERVPAASTRSSTPTSCRSSRAWRIAGPPRCTARWPSSSSRPSRPRPSARSPRSSASSWPSEPAAP